jgi:hypothetical protein
MTNSYLEHNKCGMLVLTVSTSLRKEYRSTQASAGGEAAAAPEGVCSEARRHLPLPPRGGRWLPCIAMLGLAL